MPKPFESVPATTAGTASSTITPSTGSPAMDNVPVEAAAALEISKAQASSSSFWTRFKAWLHQNGAVLILNFGSMCTLVGFTRSDVLELRALSTTGSLTFVIYNIMDGLRNPAMGIRWPPVLWSLLFASVNSYKIVQILDERKSQVYLKEHEESIYVEHFMPHGMTPKQFHKALSKSKTLIIPKGKTLIRQGEPIKSIYLVVHGKTRAVGFAGRRLTAASSSAGKAATQRGGDSGAWVGEMTFLEVFWQKETKNNKEINDKKFRLSDEAIYSVFAETDCEVLEWSQEDMEEVMHMSTDMRGSMTRAMTAAIVGKVINFTVSQSAGTSAFSSWLKDWKNTGGGAVRVESAKVETEEEEVNESKTENVPVPKLA